MGKYRVFVMYGVAVIIALIATFLIINWLQTKAKVTEAVPQETQEVAVAKGDLKWGTVITKQMIETRPFLKKSLPGGYFTDPSALAGRVLISSVRANEPIFESRLAPITVKTGGVGAMVTPKKRAMAVKVDKVIGVSGFIYPGNRVDVLVTLPIERTQTYMTKTVLENILVLAAGPEIEAKGKEEKSSTVDVITLEVTPEEAEKLALSATQGRLQLVLRNFSDTEDVITKGTTVPILLASYSYGPVQEAKALPALPVRTAPMKRPTFAVERIKKPVYTVEVIRGGPKSIEVKEVKFETE